jgi:hypothetical protein
MLLLLIGGAPAEVLLVLLFIDADGTAAGGGFGTVDGPPAVVEALPGVDMIRVIFLLILLLQRLCF